MSKESKSKAKPHEVDEVLCKLHDTHKAIYYPLVACLESEHFREEVEGTSGLAVEHLVKQAVKLCDRLVEDLEELENVVYHRCDFNMLSNEDRREIDHVD
jgi:hypothetical protein